MSSIIHRQALVVYTPLQMFELVHGVEAYPSFLPWCAGAKILADQPSERVASVTFAKGALHKSFTTRNVFEVGHSIHIHLVEGPFKKLAGSWQFLPVGTAGTKIIFDLEFEFSTKVLEKMAGPIFHHIANTFVQAFCERAEKMYGRSKNHSS